jgi:hypothetical protein
MGPVTASRIARPRVRPTASIALLTLGARARRPHASADPCGSTAQPEEALFGLLDDDDFSVLLVHAQLVQCSLESLSHRPAGCLHPLHD